VSLVHLVLLHVDGSTNPLGVSSNTDMVAFYPYFVIKDIFGFFFILSSLFVYFVFFDPNVLNHPDNYIRADSLATPSHIVPEWYYLVFYAILRAVPHKLGGVLCMFGAILLLFVIP
jgi:ubiquinol-cytochrome c reductase cytochrome b subunit